MFNKDSFKVAFTGHRHLLYKNVVPKLAQINTTHPGATWITGGAYGLDTHAAHYALDHSIPLWLILPFSVEVLCKRWPQDDARLILARSVKECARLTVLNTRFSMGAYQVRNVAMVDACDCLYAFFDGSSGGTANCVKYALQVGRNTVRV